MAQIMTTRELSKYLKLHEITICKYAAQGIIPSIRIGRVWRFDKEAIDKWIREGQPPNPPKPPKAPKAPKVPKQPKAAKKTVKIRKK